MPEATGRRGGHEAGAVVVIDFSDRTVWVMLVVALGLLGVFEMLKRSPDEGVAHAARVIDGWFTAVAGVIVFGMLVGWWSL